MVRWNERAGKYQRGKQGVPVFIVRWEQGGEEHVSQVNERVIEQRKGGGVTGSPGSSSVCSHMSSQAASAASFHDSAAEVE